MPEPADDPTTRDPDDTDDTDDTDPEAPDMTTDQETRPDGEATAETAGDTPDDAAAPGWRRWVPTSPRARAVVAAVVVLALAGGGLLWWQGRGPVPDGAAFVVGDQVVTVADLRDRQSTFKALYGVEEPAGGEAQDTYRRDVAKSVAVGLVLENAARDRGVTVADSVVDQTLTAYVTNFFGAGDEGRGAFLDALGQAGSSEDEVRLEVERQLVVARLFQEVTADVAAPSDDALQAAYTDRRCDLRIPEQRDIRNIVVATRAEAEQVRRALASGTAAFPQLVLQRSIDQASRAEQGRLGRLGLADLEQAYGTAAFAAQRGQVFGPVQSQFGWNVGQVNRIVPPRQASFADTRAALSETLVDEQRSAQWRSWLTDQLTAADVQYADGYRPADPTSPPDVGAAADPGETGAQATSGPDAACGGE